MSLLGCIVLVLLEGCGTSFNVVSPDGKVTITLNAASLPSGVRAKDVRIVPVVPDDSLLFGNERPLALYRLEPDGLQLAKPASVMIDVQPPAGRIPGLYHLSANGIERVAATSALDQRSGKAVISASIAHFSVLIVKSEDFDVSVAAPSYVFVGDPFDVTGSVRKITDKRDVIVAESGTEWFDTLVRSLGLNAATLQPREIIGELEIVDPWSVEDKLQALDGSPVTPVLHQEPRQNINGKTHDYTKQFTCTEPGSISIRYNPAIQTPNTRYKNLAPKSVEMSTSAFPHTVLADDIECFDYVFCGGMRLDEALAIAGESCDGAFAGSFTCDETAGTWSINLAAEKPGCTLVCAVNAETKRARMEEGCEGI